MPAGFSSFQVGDAAPPASRARPTCEPCRQRKVRCNRKLPCGHCSRLRLQCVYAKRSRRAPLEAHSGVSESPNSVSSPPASGDDSFGGRTGEPSNKEVLERLTNVERLLSDLVSSLSSGRLHQSVAEAGRAAQETAVAPKEPNRPCGKQLLIGGGERGNYIDESLFAEVLLGDPKDEHPQPVPPRRLADNPSQPSGIVTTDVFGHEVDELCLSAQTYTELWKIYLQNVDPLMKILHVPTAHPKVLEAVINPHQTNETTMALLYAVCFAATATIPKQETKEQLGFERLTLLRYLMHRLDASLTKAKVLMYPNVEALQALVIYLSTLRTHDTSRTLWVIGGIAIRLAESLGVHQDGMRLGLSPFEAETRCRLWWHVGALDSTAPEDHGFDSTVMDRCQSFRAPLNVHDADLFPQMTALPAGKAEWTETTFSLANTDIHRTLRQTVAANRSESIAEQEKAVWNAQDLLWRRWLRLADLSKPVCRAADAVLRIAVLKTLFLCNLRCWLSTSGVDPAASSRYRRLPDGIFLAAVDLLENAYLLQSGKASGNFSWLFQQRPQLYAFFLALHALKDGPDRPEAERAWRAVDDYSLCLTDFEEAHERKGRTSCVWRILGPLRKKARESRRRMVNGTFDAHRGDGSPESSSASTVANEACGAYTMPDASSEESYESLRQGDPFAMDAMTFDSILAWQDFAGWFDVGQNAI